MTSECDLIRTPCVCVCVCVWGGGGGGGGGGEREKGRRGTYDKYSTYIPRKYVRTVGNDDVIVD